MASNNAALYAIDRKLGQLRLLTGLTEAGAEKAAKAVEREINRTLKAGQAPDGTPWKPKQDGGKPLKRAAEKVNVGAIGSTIIVRLKDRPTVLHHFGYARGKVKREVIPTELPPAMSKAIDKAIREAAEDIRRA